MPGSVHRDFNTLGRGSGRQWPLILAATGFNLLFEYSWRGVNNIIQVPLLFVALFILYMTLFTILDDLIVEFRLRDYHLVIAAFFYGTIYEFLASGALYYQQGFLQGKLDDPIFYQSRHVGLGPGCFYLLPCKQGGAAETPITVAFKP